VPVLIKSAFDPKRTFTLSLVVSNPQTPVTMDTSLPDRFSGCLLGLACGDALGTALEFRRPGTFEPLCDMVGGGPFDLAPGKWTDDTSMALCLAESLLYCGGFDARDQMARYTNWWQWGYLSSTGECFDIGYTVRSALTRFSETCNPFSGSTDPMAAGNGSLMRLAPVVMYFYPDRNAVDAHSIESSRTTHGAAEAIECCRLLGLKIFKALDGCCKEDILLAEPPGLTEPRVVEVSRGSFLRKRYTEISGSGYAVASLEAALWCFAHNSDYPSTVLAAANLGDDADTTAAIAGQLAGAHYGVGSIPSEWLRKLHMREAIHAYAERLAAEGWHGRHA
jgi:ADP-ribosyl-[dinitrogen reductase] hydrolase